MTMPVFVWDMRPSELIENGHAIGKGNGTRGNAVREGHALEPLHNEIGAPIIELADGEDVDDIGVPYPVHRARFLNETRHRRGLRADGFAHHLDDDTLADDRVDGRIDRPHPAFSEFALDFVVPDTKSRCQRNR
jgi:hypothetical protein